jgi:microcystin-dependent protein
MECTNCFSGCVSTTSDKCVKYTGTDITFLGISSGDTLNSVEKAITDYLATVYTGEGILPTIDPSYLCTVVNQYFPVGTPTAVDILTAIIRAVCDIEAEIVVERARIDVIEDTYTVGDCLTVDPDAGTHAVLEAVMAELCDVVDDITTINNLLATCITTSTIDTYIQNYINTITASTYMYSKMVPYVIYPFYPTAAVLASFSVNGIGSGAWDKVYMCNGENGTPDLRGRSLIGVTNNVGGGAFHVDVDPALGNPTYTLGTTGGKNTITLSAAELAEHTHVATAVVTDAGHETTISFKRKSTSVGEEGGTECAYPVLQIEDKPITNICSDIEGPITAQTAISYTGITVAVTNAVNAGAGSAHENVHPVYACYYVMYLP